MHRDEDNEPQHVILRVMGTRSAISKGGVSATTTRSLFGVRSDLVREIALMMGDWERAKRYGDYYPFEEIVAKRQLLEEVDAELKRRNQIINGD